MSLAGQIAICLVHQGRQLQSCQILALSCRCTVAIPTSSEAAITKSDVISYPQRGLSREAIRYVGVGSMLLMRLLRMERMPTAAQAIMPPFWMVR